MYAKIYSICGIQDYRVYSNNAVDDKGTLNTAEWTLNTPETQQVHMSHKMEEYKSGQGIADSERLIIK